MSHTDPISDLLTRIRNAHLAKHDRLDAPTSKLRLEVCRMLKEQGYIENFELVDVEQTLKSVRIYLRYDENGRPAIRRLRRVSKPGRRVYRGAKEIPRVLNGLGLGIISTSRGLLTDQEARQQRIGGEFLCEVW